MKTGLLVGLGLGLCVTSTTMAQAPPPMGLAPQPKQEKNEFTGAVDGRLGFGQVDEDVFMTVNGGTAMRWGQLGWGIQVPLRIRLNDEAPKDSSVIRKEDWDEVSDWTRVIRFVEWGSEKKPEPVYARLGDLNGITLGHGTIVDRYYNVIDADHYQTGVFVKTDLGVAGGSFFMDNIVDPELVGVRGMIRPLTFGKWGEFYDRFTVGVTLVGDTQAPREPKYASGGDERRINGDGDLMVNTEPLWLFGVDLGWKVIETEQFALTPYVDLNVMGATRGTGFHTGLLATIQAGQSVTFGTRLEYRAVTEDYAPNYVNSWYEIERLDFRDSADDAPSITESVPKLDYYMRRSDAGKDAVLHGFHSTVDMTLFKAITIGGTYEDTQGAYNSNLMLRLLLPWIAGIKVSAYYAKRNFEKFSEAFDLDGGLLVADAKWRAYGPLFVYARYSREWHLKKEGNDKGHYETINDYDIGVGAQFTF